VLTATIAALVASWLLNQTAKTREEIEVNDSVMLVTLKSKVIEFSAKNKRLPTGAEFQVLSAGFTDRLGRSPIYLYSSSLASSDLCSATNSLIAISDCGSDPTCGTPVTTPNIPFVLIATGNSVANPLAIISQTALSTATEAITTSSTLTRFAPNTSVGSLADRTKDIGLYDDKVVESNFTELWTAAECKTATQGDIASQGVSVRILNTTGALPNAFKDLPYTSSTVPFVAYGSSLSSYAWSSIDALPTGITLKSAGNTAYIEGIPTIAGSYNINIKVVASSPSGNTPTSSVLKTLLVCEFWGPTGNVRSASCATGFTGAISQNEIKELCGGTTQWVDVSNTCVAIPVDVSVTVDQTTLNAAGAMTTLRNLGSSSIVINGVTITAGSNSSSFGDRNLSIDSTSTTTALGVMLPSATTGAAISGAESLKFTFQTPNASAYVAFKSLGVIGSEKSTITFYSGGASVGTQTVTACSNDTFVAFKNISPGVPFDSLVVTPSGGSRFYVAGVKGCSSSTCQSGLAATIC
jgi:hypothetical protein